MKAAYLTAVLALALASGSAAMDAQVVGDQLILSGPVVKGDFDKIQDALAGFPPVSTVILRNSPGGDAPTGYRTGELFREKGLRTAVSGYCYSSCSRMFLGGRVRLFTDDLPMERTNVGFHGHYDRAGKLLPGLMKQYGLQDWIVRYSDGKADPALVERWINIPVNVGMIHFFHPGVVQRHGVSTFMCEGPTPPGLTWFDCEPIPQTALDLGVITSLDIIRSNDVVR